MFTVTIPFRKMSDTVSWLKLISLSALLSVAACTTYESQSFEAAKGGNVESAQISADADFSKYDRLQAEDMGIFFPAGAGMPAADQQRLRQSFRDAFVAELAGYQVTREPGPTTMKVQASLIDLRNSSGADMSALRREVRDVAKTGSLVFLMEMRDSQTDRVLARAADSAKTPVLSTGTDSKTDWQAVEDAAQHWAKLFRQFLDQNLGQ
jgi:hypothetical protein